MPLLNVIAYPWARIAALLHGARELISSDELLSLQQTLKRFRELRVIVCPSPSDTGFAQHLLALDFKASDFSQKAFKRYLAQA